MYRVFVVEDEAGFVVMVVVAGCFVVVVVVGEEAGFVVVVVAAGFRTAGGGSSSAGGGIGCGSGRSAVRPERHAQRSRLKHSMGRRNTRSPEEIRTRFPVLPMRLSMPHAPGKVRMGFGSTKTAGRR